MTPVEKICAEILEASGKATPRPWTKAPVFKSQWPDKYNDTANVRGVRLIGPYASVSCGNDSEFVLLSANNAPRLAQALIRAMEAISKMDCTCGSEGHEDSSYQGGGCDQHRVLSDIEKLFSEEGKCEQCGEEMVVVTTDSGGCFVCLKCQEEK